MPRVLVNMPSQHAGRPSGVALVAFRVIAGLVARRIGGDAPVEPVFLAFDGAMLALAALFLLAIRTIARRGGASRGPAKAAGLSIAGHARRDRARPGMPVPGDREPI